MSASQLTRKQRAGMRKLGDAYIRPIDDLPAFSATTWEDRVDGMLEPLPEADRNDLLMVLGILGRLPASVSRRVPKLLESLQHVPGPVGVLVRTARVGFKGAIFSLYYSDPVVTDIIGFAPHVARQRTATPTSTS